jgi:hypothetical protein
MNKFQAPHVTRRLVTSVRKSQPLVSIARQIILVHFSKIHFNIVTCRLKAGILEPALFPKQRTS